MFKNPLSFKGRIRRLEFGLTVIIFYATLALIGLMTDDKDGIGPITSVLMFVIIIPLYWFFFAQGAKRCHDRGNSGFYQIIPFYIFWMLFADGEPNINEYGPNPKKAAEPNEFNEIGNELIDDQTNHHNHSSEL